MKRIILSVLAMSALLCGCQKDHVSELTHERGTIQATIEEISSTRTVMDENNNIRWSEGDQIVGFMKSTLGVKYQVTAASVGKTSASFEEVSSGGLNAGTELEHIIAYYPYSSSVSAAKSGASYTLDVVLPTEQTYVAESFGNGSMAMVAVNENNNITFRNVLGGMKFQLRGTQKVESIKLEGKNNEKLSGAATVTAYTDETKPAITMASGAFTSVTLNCGSGVQLNESKATEFIIALPPVLFSKGFTVTVTDADSKTYTVETDKANTVLRSSILNMPVFKLGNSPSDEGSDDELVIPVFTVSLSSTSLKFYEGESHQLTATVKPNDATDKTVVWSSNAPVVATVDQAGLVTGISAGTTYISASAGGKVAKCTITISSRVVATADYIDEYGVNHGKGTSIGTAIWAPVNCGYHKDDYKYGKLYQWGRKYGQGYSGNLNNINGKVVGEDSDATVPTIEEGGITILTGIHKSKANVFFTSSDEYNGDWLYPQDDKLWNSGSESDPVKTENDPCPDGWRVPTYAELNELIRNYSSKTTDENGRSGFWLSGPRPYTESVPQVFFPAAGLRYSHDGHAGGRGSDGRYWSSRPGGTGAYNFYFYLHEFYTGSHSRALGESVRCVQE